MKKLASIFIASSLLLMSCGDSKKEQTSTPQKTTTTEKKIVKKKAVIKENTASSGNAAEGKKIFGSKGCTACHHETTKIIGPAVQLIASIYAEKSGDILKFLKGDATAIVDTDPGQVAIMKSNVDTMLKDMSDSDLANIVAYIKSVK